MQWEKRSSVETRSEIESLREEIFREFEAQKKVEILETLEEAKEAWMEESEELKREDVNEAMAYLESEYTKRMEEFKHTELKEALEKARQQWTAEELSRREEIVKVKRKLSMFALYVLLRAPHALSRLIQSTSSPSEQASDCLLVRCDLLGLQRSLFLESSNTLKQFG